MMSRDQSRGSLWRRSGTVFIGSVTMALKTLRVRLDSEKSLSALLFGTVLAAMVVVFDQLIELWAGAIWFGVWALTCLLGFVGLAMKGAFVCDSSPRPQAVTPVAQPADAAVQRGQERRARLRDNERRARVAHQQRADRATMHAHG